MVANQHSQRLSDRVLSALELAIEQEDTDIADKLVEILEFAMTRKAGGVSFKERRDYPPEIESALDKLADIKAKERL